VSVVNHGCDSIPKFLKFLSKTVGYGAQKRRAAPGTRISVGRPLHGTCQYRSQTYFYGDYDRFALFDIVSMRGNFRLIIGDLTYMKVNVGHSA
jgi:hypothetical protein